ncbi:UDP-3-O-acyl-N-acetylglucosamine deacetylase [Acetobacter sp. AN02]|uniref:UDP-3-O-acyl-N-acetylglucosamine deacetylase n=1 Tax=Acetobacter sp. AN02 TaxID=2894186 RepID=UPI00243468D3|nr:UDP-3-O-acyl-N-acetylglucosamine deacetylase [Acetobacter sp. AN02]MDG6094712.1 UDP-3-O-acyl-N-acetylglucosamine deacetylase [Acetobacter sp. AN02]
MDDFSPDMMPEAEWGFTEDSAPGDVASYYDGTVLLFSQKDRVLPESAPVQQRTLKNTISFAGVGLHSGRSISVSLEPAETGYGIVFQRTDINASPLPARYDYVSETRLCTMLGHPSEPGNIVGTIEHLMAALSAAGVTNLRVLIDGPEMPVLDGSAADFVFLLDCAGVCDQGSEQDRLHILKTVRVEHGDAWVELSPGRSDCFSIDLGINFSAPVIGRQSVSFVLSEPTFRNRIACSRTFVMRQEIEALRAVGLARGGSLKNALVVENDTVLNPDGLRVQDEFVRHKALDVIGDLALAGAPMRGCFRGYKSGHALNNTLLRNLFADPDAWSFGRRATVRKDVPGYSVAA